MKKQVIIDTDIGGDPDDFVALLLALNSENISIDLIVTNEENGCCRAALIKEILRLTDNEHIKVVKGEDTGSTFFMLDYESDNTVQSNYIQEIDKVVKKNEMTLYLGIGSLTNVSNYLKECKDHPALELAQMGGSTKRQEHNFNLDYPAAKHIFSQDLEITLITSEITNNESILITETSPLYKFIQNSDSEVFKLLMKNIENFNFPFFLHDPLALSYITNDTFLTFQPAKVSFLDSGVNMYNECLESNQKISISAKYDENREYVRRKLHTYK